MIAEGFVIRVRGKRTKMGTPIKWVGSFEPKEGGAKADITLCDSPLDAERFSRLQAGRVLKGIKATGRDAMVEQIEPAKSEWRRRRN